MNYNIDKHEVERAVGVINKSIADAKIPMVEGFMALIFAYEMAREKTPSHFDFFATRELFFKEAKKLD